MTIVDAFGTPIGTGRAVTEKYTPGPRFLWGQQPRDLPLFSFEMIKYMLLDQTIKLGLAMRAAPLCAAQFGYEENGQWTDGVRADKPDVKAFVESQLRKVWDFHIHKLLSAQVWGWSGGEVTYKTEDVPGTTKKRIVIDDLLGVHAADCRALTRHGKLAGVRVSMIMRDLSVPGTGYWHAFNPDPRSFYGRGVLIGAYSAWADKWLDGGALDVRRLFMHTDAYGGARIGYPPGTMDIDGKGENIPNRDVAREIVEQYRSGSVQTYPNVYDEHGNKLWTVEDAKVSGNPGHILQYPKDLDVEMLRGLEIPDDVLTAEATGSWQGKQVPMQAFYQGLNRWLFELVACVTQQILEPLVLWNWGRAEDFHVEAKPLDQQAMEQSQQAQQPPGEGQPGAEGGGLDALLGGGAPQDTGEGSVPGLPGPLQPNPQQMGLNPVAAVGAGVLSATHLVKAARMLLDERDPFVIAERNRALANEQPVDNQAKYGCVMLKLPPDVAGEVRQLGQQIAIEDLTEEGLEHDPHITAMWGVVTDEADEVREAVKTFGPFGVRLGRTSVFENDEHDVVKIDVIGAAIHEFHDHIGSRCACEETHPVYVPHVTIGYVKKGRGSKYVNLDAMEGAVMAFNHVVFSDRSKNKYYLPLQGVARMAFVESEHERANDGKFTSSGATHETGTEGGDKPKSKRRQRAETALQKAAVALDKGSVPKAKRLLEEAEQFGATDEELTPLRALLAKNRVAQAKHHDKSAPTQAAAAPSGPPFADPVVSDMKTDPANVLQGGRVTFKYNGSFPNPVQSLTRQRQVDPGGDRTAKVRKVWRPKLNRSDWVQALVSFDEPMEVSDDAGKTWKRQDKRVSAVVDIIGDQVMVADKDYRLHGAQVLTDHPGLQKKPKKASYTPLAKPLPKPYKAMATARAPVGGITIGGLFFPGGRFIPEEHLARATPEQRAELDRHQANADRHAPRDSGELQPVSRDKKGRIVPPRGKELPEHLLKLRLPPAWKNVHVNFHPQANLVATGTDEKGRKQSVYSDSHACRQAAAKFQRITELKRSKEKIAATVTKHAKSSDPTTRDSADVLRLIMTTGLRPGSDRDTKAEQQAYGATTLRAGHVIVQGQLVSLQFVGKKGVHQNVQVTDPDMAKILRRRKKAASDPNHRLFSISDSDLRAYVKAVAGKKFKPKDFRTLKGTETAAAYVAANPKCCQDQRTYKQHVREVAKQVANVLGNTPTIALQAYINPMVFTKWRPAT